MNDEGECNDTNPNIKPVAQVFIFVVDQECEDNPIDGFQVESEACSKRRELFQGIGRKLEGNHGTAPGKYQQPANIRPARPEMFPRRVKLKKQRQQQTKTDEAAGLLPEQECLYVCFFQVFPVENREYGRQDCRGNAEQYPRFVVRVEMEDHVNTAHGNKTKQQLAPVNCLAQKERFKQCCEKACSSKANQRNGYVGFLNGGIKCKPVKCGYHAHAHDLPAQPRRDFLYLPEGREQHPHRCCRKKKPYPHNHAGIDSNQPAKNTGETGEKNSNMKLEKSFAHRAASYQNSGNETGKRGLFTS